MGNDNLAKSFRSVYFPVIVMLMLCAVIIFCTHVLLSGRINRNAQEYELRVVKNILQIPYDNDVLSDSLQVTDPEYFGNEQPVTIYRARSGNDVVATIFKPLTANGYKGAIQYALCIKENGEIQAVKTLQHSETEGLGGLIDDRKLDWLGNFKDISLATMQTEDWGIRDDGGKFDQITGATITSKGIINSIHKTLEYHDRYHDKIYSTRVDKK